MKQRPLTRPDELADAYRLLYATRAVAAEEMVRLRQQLTAWADSIPHHQITHFGRDIVVGHAAVAPYYRVAVRTQYERRRAERRQMPFRGTPVPPAATTEANLRLWSYAGPPGEGFEPARHEQVVDDSRDVQECHPG